MPSLLYPHSLLCPLVLGVNFQVLDSKAFSDNFSLLFFNFFLFRVAQPILQMPNVVSKAKMKPIPGNKVLLLAFKDSEFSMENGINVELSCFSVYIFYVAFLSLMLPLAVYFITFIAFANGQQWHVTYFVQSVELWNYIRIADRRIVEARRRNRNRNKSDQEFIALFVWQSW